MPSFNGRVVLITGAASGIGQATAVEFARCGARLALTDVNETGLQETVKLCKQHGLTDEGLHVVTGDLFAVADIERIARQVVEHFQGVDILVNNAGRSEKGDGPVELISDDALENAFKLLYKAPVLMTQKLIPSLRERKGNVVNMGSALGLVPQWYCLGYSIMKSALAAFTTAAAQELAPDIRVNSVCPGPTDTGLHAVNHPDPVKREVVMGVFRRRTALGRFATPEEIAKAVVYLASDDAAFITGHNLAIDGGDQGAGVFTHQQIMPILKNRFPDRYKDSA